MCWRLPTGSKQPFGFGERQNQCHHGGDAWAKHWLRDLLPWPAGPRARCSRAPIFRLEERIAADPSLQAIQVLINEVLAALSRRFQALYLRFGRPTIPPEYLLRATLMQAFFSVRSER